MSSWKYINLGNAATFVNGYPFKPSEWSNAGKEIIRIQNLTRGASQTNYYEGELHERYKVRKGDLLISWSATLGVYEWEREDAWLNQHIFKVIFNKENFDKDYFKYLMVSALRKLEDQVHGATMKHITKAKFDAFQIPLPPLTEQKKIATLLDAADSLRQKDKALVAKYDELTQSLFLEMFGDPVRNEKGWEKVRIYDFGKIVTGNTPPRNNENNYNANYIEWIKTDNIPSNDLFVTQAQEYLSKEGLAQGRSVDSGALLVACIAGSIKSIGRAALTDRRVALNQQINAIQPNGNISGLFLYYLFKCSAEYIQEHASNGMKRMLSKGDFQKIVMIKPPLEMQTEFEERVKVIEKQKSLAQVGLKKSEELFEGLLGRVFKNQTI